MAGLIPYNLDFDIVNDTQKVVTSTWSNNTNNLTTAHTASAQAIFSNATSSGAFFIASMCLLIRGESLRRKPQLQLPSPLR